ncbi:hypothetical protein BpHYR1_028769 [Brachionus plicatilis]|uniref:Uncharacterized protein n=1 Tax=Brachionus plicatilis TaxID=10195 RepID=A0A3M7RS92_BRAPC|nr:hypothetical protein BpHYR1_028769 [Brachionus plicatilis]
MDCIFTRLGILTYSVTDTDRAFNIIQGNFLYSGYLSKDRTVQYKLYLFVFVFLSEWSQN